MTDSGSPAVLAAVAGGYLLGRTKKAKLAVTLAALVLGRKATPHGLLGAGAKKVAGASGGSGLPDQVTSPVAAARAAVGSLVDNGVESLAASLRERTDRLGGQDETDDAPGAEQEDVPDDEGDGTGERRRRKPASKHGSQGRTKSAAGAKNGRGGTDRPAGRSGKGTGTGRKAAKKPAERSRKGGRS